MSEQPKKRPTVLTRLRIDEVSLVDKGAGHGCKIVISKRDESADDNRPVEMPEHERRYWQALGKTALRHAEERYAKENGTGAADHLPADDEPENPFLKIFRKGNDADADIKSDGREAIADIVEDALDQDDDGKPTADGGNDHHASKVADLLVESGKHPDRQSALDHLLHTAQGAAMLRRLHKSAEDTTTMNPTDKLRDIAKRYGIGAIAKSIVEDDHAYSIDEHEFTSLVVECAVRDNPNLTEAQAFTKVFTEQSEAGTMLRKAFNVVKSATRADSVTSYPFPKF